MLNNLIRKYLPKRLFTRAIIIILFPIFLIELTVGIGFFQRHYEQVTNQMAESILLEIKYIQGEVNSSKNKKEATRILTDLEEKFEFDIYFLNKSENLNFQKPNLFDYSGKAFLKKIDKEFNDNLNFDFDNKIGRVGIIIKSNFGDFLIYIPRNRISASNPHQLIVLMIFLSSLLLFLAFMILRNQIKPIIKLAEVSEAFGKGISLNYKPRGSEEVRKAGLAFLSMRNRIEKHLEQRTKMLSSVSHDLRTPLTRLKLSLSFLKKNKDVIEMLKDIDNMSKMLDTFLTFSKNVYEEETEEIILEDFLNDLIQKNKDHYKKINFELNSDINKQTSLPIRLTSLERAFQNLIDNSSNFAKKIHINLYNNKKFIIICFEDNGPGIKKADRENALKPFTRLDNSRNQNLHAGVGLGLSISKDIILNHGGTLSLEDSEELKGLKIKIALPK